MGATYLETIIKTQSDKILFRIYDDMYWEAKSYYGSNPYSGSWATLSNVMIVKDPYPERRWTVKKYSDVRRWLMDNTDKWEEAKAVKSPKGFIVGGWAAT